MENAFLQLNFLVKFWNPSSLKARNKNSIIALACKVCQATSICYFLVCVEPWAADHSSGSSTMMTMIYLEKLGARWTDMECATVASVPELLDLINFSELLWFMQQMMKELTVLCTIIRSHLLFAVFLVTWCCDDVRRLIIVFSLHQNFVLRRIQVVMR